MKIVIELDDNVYGLLKRTERVFKYIDKEDDTVDTALMRAVINGTPLPKGCSRLISADSLIKAIEEKAKRLSNVDTINGLCGAVALIFDAPTIVESDKGVLEKINEKQDSLRATCKAWDEAIEKDGYVN